MSQVLVHSVMIVTPLLFCVCLSCSYIHLDTTTSLPGYRYALINLFASPPVFISYHSCCKPLCNQVHLMRHSLFNSYIDLMTAHVQPFFLIFGLWFFTSFACLYRCYTSINAIAVGSTADRWEYIKILAGWFCRHFMDFVDMSFQ